MKGAVGRGVEAQNATGVKREKRGREGGKRGENLGRGGE